MATAWHRSTRKGCPNRGIGFKRELAAAACAPGVSVAKLALEHRVNTNLLFKWRREYRAGKFGVPDPAHLEVAKDRDLASAVRRPETAVMLLPVQAPLAEAEAVAGSACIEVVFATATVRIRGAPAPAALRVVLDTLVRRT